MNNKIRHSGIIDSIGERSVKVRILQTSACAACKVAAHCNASESKEKLIDVASDGKGLHVGDAVTVCASRTVISHAMLLAFGLPLALMVVTLVTLLFLTGDEATSGLLSLLVLAPYYLIIWLLRNRIDRRISFTIEDD